MRKFKLKKWVAAGLIVSMPYAAIVDAAGLGGMNVLSQLGQPFSAEIDLVNVSKEELATLTARLASPDAYRNANLQYNPVLNGMRLAVERRPDGRPFIRATSARPVAEPFLDMLVELTWNGGRIVREYSALLDPPGMEAPVAAAVTAPVVSAPVAKPAPAAKPPVAVETPAPAPAAKSAPAPVAAAPASAAPARPIGGSEYAVKQGDTLGQIAAGMRPEGISLDQMMIGLLRANPDAFINNNINLVRAGKILKAPERDQLAAIGASDASQEVRVQAGNWNSYRTKVADTAPAVADAAPATKGKITTRVEDKAAAAGPKDVVVLSKGEGAAGKGGDAKAADRVRALQEDLNARDKALAESKERVAILEKTIKDMQKLAEVKSPAMAAAQQAGKDAKGDAKADGKASPKPEVKAEPPKPEAKAPEAPKPEAKAPDAPKPEAPKLEAKAEAPKAADPVPAPKAAPPAPKAPAKAAQPEPGIMDTVMDNIIPIGGAGAVLAGLAGLWAVRRRKKDGEVVDDEPAMAKTEPFTGNVDGAVAGAAGSVAAVAATPEPTVSNVTDTVDPIEEAQVYIDHGRDNQAEDILKEAMVKDPQRQDVQLKLLEVYAARGDKGAFNKLAKDFNALTGGVGENWDKAAAMGHAIDPSNALYPSTGEMFDIGAGGDVSDATVDLNISNEDNMGTTTDILLDQGGTDSSMDKTMMMTRSDVTPAAPTPAAEPVVPEFNLELPPVTAEEEPQTVNPNVMDFNLDLPALDAAPVVPVAEAAKPADDGGLDFKVDMSGINLNLDDKPATGGGEKDAHWNDVQQKFDLARAYQDMGDKDGAKEILREVVREGDATQKSEAQALLDSIK
ncbi:MAG: FimV/HubP family polar landmark protein [Burkholderiales bacterium]